MLMTHARTVSMRAVTNTCGREAEGEGTVTRKTVTIQGRKICRWIRETGGQGWKKRESERERGGRGRGGGGERGGRE